uniref:Uncharacterized protein n=1 Tax=Dulem virus 101 TaxID=3145578 RepID=A0AAU8BAR7_9VIRU
MSEKSPNNLIQTKTFLFRVYDETIQRPGPIFEASSDDLAIHAFKTMYPTDSVSEFSLYRVGEFEPDGLVVRGEVRSDNNLLIRGVDVFHELEHDKVTEADAKTAIPVTDLKAADMVNAFYEDSSKPIPSEVMEVLMDLPGCYSLESLLIIHEYFKEFPPTGDDPHARAFFTEYRRILGSCDDYIKFDNELEALASNIKSFLEAQKHDK